VGNVEMSVAKSDGSLITC